ncbi:MAG TPA: FIST N-terminal domain-containing protein [Gaiellaceae bacterium]|nr:FIST N-terminal domain-containing protein [Gaiellaceae bacterium]
MRPETLTRRVGAGLSLSTDAAEAAGEAAREARAALGGAAVDLAFLFLSGDHFGGSAEALAVVEEELGARHLLGCVAEGVVARDRELEDGPGAAVWAASLPDAEIETFHSVALGTDEGVAVTGFPILDEADLVTLLVDPYTFPAAGFLAKLNEEEDSVPLVGGLAAGGGDADSQALFVDGDVVYEGAVGAVLRGVPVRTVVSQGCEPVGRDSVITHAEDNVVFELAGEPALERLKGDVATLTPDQERSAAAGGVLAGLVIDENRADYGRGDYLMRALIGVDEETGALAIGEAVRIGQTLRFHVRDAASADEDLRENLRSTLNGERAAGALLFTCNGRGTGMFDEPDHDARAVAELLGDDALAGFFCAGELGPVGGKPFLHGFTATLAVFLED